MKAKLIKTEKCYHLDTGSFDGIHLACYPHDVTKQRLSLKNCQAIEHGYDLDELAGEFTRDESYGKFSGDLYKGYIFGFQKALKLMGDKKFSEEDVIKIAEYIRVASQSTPNVRTKELFDEYQSLQQTEWDVEIEMEEVAIGDKYTPEPKPKLDADGCLILKLKSE